MGKQIEDIDSSLSYLHTPPVFSLCLLGRHRGAIMAIEVAFCSSPIFTRRSPSTHPFFVQGRLTLAGTQQARSMGFLVYF